MRLLLALPLCLIALSACETGPRERIARAGFACEDGRRLRAAFNLDQGVVEVRVEKSKLKPVLIAKSPGVAGRAYAQDGYSLTGVGDQITYATPDTPATRCTETH